MKYFTKRVEFPELSGELLPVNTLWEYISSSFLDGIINHYNIIGWFVLDNDLYDGIDPVFEDMHDLTYAEKLERIDSVRLNGFDNPRLMIREFEDNLIFVGKSNVSDCEYCYFYYDTDISDCCVGRFVTDDSHDEILSKPER